MDIWTVGTSSAVPSKQRSLPANLISFKGERFLFDCGEGTQQKLMQHKLGLMKINRIFITHWHADHFSGLIGLVQTLEMEGRDKPLYIYGPKGTEKFTEKLLELGYFQRSYDIFAEELEEGEEIVGEDWKVKPFQVEHSIPALGYVFEETPQKKANKEKMKELGLQSSPKIGKLKQGEEIKWKGETIKPEDVIEEVKGRKIVYTGDTEKTKNTVKHAQDADLLIHEATCSHDIIDQRHGHSSAKQAAEVAKEGNVEKLVLTHISRRYKNGKEKNLVEEAQEVFSNTVLAEDGEKFEVKPHRPE